MSQRKRREQIETLWRDKLHEAEQAYGAAFAKTRQIQSELPSMSPADGDLALARVLQEQSHAMDEYMRVLQTFTRLVIYGEEPDDGKARTAPLAATESKSISDLDIQQWVFKHHGFIPHPSWIAHCKELYLGMPPEHRLQDCPPDKRNALKEAFLALGVLNE